MSRSIQDLSQTRSGLKKSGHPKEANHFFMDRWIAFREILFNRISGINANEVLNDYTAGTAHSFGKYLAVELKCTLDSIKIAAIDESGDHVDYAALRVSPDYRLYRDTLAPGLNSFDPMILRSRSERLAFWINLYNALVIDTVISLGTKHSVIEGKLGLLAFFRRAAYSIGGFRISLDDIENGILRGNQGHPLIPGKQFASKDPRNNWVIWPPEPRIHFALNCASRSCPPIQFYSSDRLDVQLDLATRNFVDADLIINPDKQLLIVSSLFQWYKCDFGGPAGVVSFLIDHLPLDGRRAWLSEYSDVIKLRYQPYNWGLNSAE